MTMTLKRFKKAAVSALVGAALAGSGTAAYSMDGMSGMSGMGGMGGMSGWTPPAQ
jgi:hypothetical protein